mgnify:CR=1 FL=1
MLKRDGRAYVLGLYRYADLESLLAALRVITARNPVHAALWLVVALGGVEGRGLAGGPDRGP